MALNDAMVALVAPLGGVGQMPSNAELAVNGLFEGHQGLGYDTVSDITILLTTVFISIYYYTVVTCCYYKLLLWSYYYYYICYSYYDHYYCD